MVDSIILFDSTEMEFVNNGIGVLSDATYCEVVEERNGEYELTMEYPINGSHYDDISLRKIIYAKPTPYATKQPFRIYMITKPINGLVTINAEHVRYDLAGYPAIPMEATSASAALNSLTRLCPVSCPFTSWSNRSQSGTFRITTPSSILTMLGGVEGSILDVYGGEYEFDKFEIKLWDQRGSDNGVTIRYGKNLTNLSQEENCSNVYTGVYPYWAGQDEDGNDILIQLEEKIVNVEGTFDYSRILELDCSSYFDNPPTETQLRNRTLHYISDNDIGIPKINLKVSFVQLEQSEEYSDYALLEAVQLCDTVTVEFPTLGVNAKSEVIKTTYNVLTDKYKSIELGSATSKTLADTISINNKSVAEMVTKTMVQTISERTAALFNGMYGGFVKFNYLDGSDQPYEILIMDTNDIATAKKVWRWNNAGLAFSNNGYNGPWIVGMNMLGEINGQIIAANTIDGNVIQSGSVPMDALSEFEQLVMRSDLSGMANYFENGQLWMRFDRDRNTGLWIGRVDSQFAVNITNTRMAFVQSNNYQNAVTISNTGSIVASFTDNDCTKYLLKTSSEPGKRSFTYNQNGWSADLSEYGITVTGTPAIGNTITVEVNDYANEGSVVAYIAYDKLMIKDSHIKEKLIFGKNGDPDNPDEEFAFIPNDNGSLKFKWVGEEPT